MNLNFRRLASTLWIAMIWFLTTSPNLKVTDNTLLQNILNSAAHFSLFGVMAILLPSPSRAQAIVVTSLYGALIELVQRNIPGRTMDPVDWALDTLGALTFVVIMRKLYKEGS